MYRKTKCSICGNEIKYKEYLNEQGILLWYCPQCGYKRYHLPYSNCKEVINGKEFLYSYDEPLSFEKMKEYNEEYEKLYKKWKGEL